MTLLLTPKVHSSDRALMQVLLVYSSSETARHAAAAWLAAFDAARAEGQAEVSAHARADAALEQALRGESGVCEVGSGMLAATRAYSAHWQTRSRSPPGASA